MTGEAGDFGNDQHPVPRHFSPLGDRLACDSTCCSDVMMVTIFVNELDGGMNHRWFCNWFVFH